MILGQPKIPTALLGFDQFVRQQAGFHGESVSAFQVPVSDRRLGLRHKFLDLADHFFLAGIELASFDLFQIFFGSGCELFGGEALLRCLLLGGISRQFNRGFARSSILDHYFRRRTRLRRRGTAFGWRGLSGVSIGCPGIR